MSTPPIPIAKPRTLPEKIMDAACTYYSISREQLQTREFTEHRKIVCYMLREQAMMKFSAIACLYGYAGHSTAVTFVEEIRATKNIYIHIKNDIDNINKIVSSLV